MRASVGLLPPLIERAGAGGDERGAEHRVQQHPRSTPHGDARWAATIDRHQLQHDDPRLGELDVIGDAREPAGASRGQSASARSGGGREATHTAASQSAS